MFDQHELTRMVMTALADNSSVPERAEAMVHCLQVRKDHPVASYIRQELAKVIAGATSETGLVDAMKNALKSGTAVSRALAFVAALDSEHDSAEVSTLVHEVLNPRRASAAAAADSRKTEG